MGAFDDLIPKKAGAFDDLIPQANTKVTPDTVVRSLAQGASFGFGDEIAAAGDAAAGPLLDPILAKLGLGGTNTSTAPSFGERYDQNLSRERTQDKAFSEAHPYVDIGGKVAGGVASTAAVLPAALTAKAPSLLGNIFKMGGTGAGLGALAGFGEGEGTEDRLGKALLGGGIGAGIGAAAPVVGVAGRAAAESGPGRAVRNAVGSIFNREPVLAPVAGAPPVDQAAESGAIQRIATALQRGKMDPENVSTRLGQLGDQAMIADVDPQFLSMARGAKVMPGSTRTLAETNLIARDREAGNRLVGALEGGEPPPSTFQANQFLDANRRQIGTDAYGGMRSAGLNESDELAQLKNIPAVRDALAQIEAEATSTGTTLAPVDVMHRVKQKLNAVADASFASGKPVNKADVGDLANRWEQAFWNANPAAKGADTAYAQASSLPDYLQSGRNFLRKGTSEAATESSAPALADLLQGANPQQRLAARVGSTNAARETALEGTRPARALAQRIDESAPVRAKLTELYGPQQAERIMQQAEAEGVFANTSNQILRGSQTAEKAVDALDLGGAGIRVSPGGVQPRIWERIGEIVSKIAAPNEAVRNQIGRITLNPNASENERILALAAELLKKRRMGSPVPAGLAQSGASVGGMVGRE